MNSWEMDESYSLGVWPRPKSLGSFCGMEEIRCSVVVDLLCFVLQPQVSHQMRDSRVKPWGGATGKPEIWLIIGAYGHVKPIMTSNGPATERT